MTLRRRLLTLAGTAAAALAIVLGLIAAPAQAQSPRSRAVSGWFGYWTDAADMIQVARSSRGRLGEVNIFWWNYAGSDHPVCTSGTDCPSSSGTPWTTSNLSRAARGLQRQGITVFGSHTDLSSWHAGSLSRYLATPARRRALAQRLTSWAVRAGLDGVDLDWENFAFNDGSSTWSTTRPRLTDTVRRLARKLHRHGKLLSVTVPGGYDPFLSSGRANPGGGYTVYNWNRLARYADRLRLMTYDYSWSRPGPIGPNDWAADVVRSAIAQVGAANRRKIYVGLHQYGKAWYSRDANDSVVTVGRCPRRWSPYGTDGIALTPAEAFDVARTYGVRPRLHRPSKELTFRYVKREWGYRYRKGERVESKCSVTKEIWFGSAATAAARGRLVKRLRIGGIAVWQLGTLANGFFAAVGPYTRVRRAPRLAIKASDLTPRTGTRIVVKGRFKPKATGVIVKRQQWIDGRWRTMSLRRSSPGGRVAFGVPVPARRATMLFRLRSMGTPSRPALVSPTIKIRSWR